MTLQGRAIKRASVDFGDGRTLPFTPCKKGYIAVVALGGGKAVRRVACPLHEKARRRRLASEGGCTRKGEADPAVLFWSKADIDNAAPFMEKPAQP
jgi:hypothetical protein